MVARTHRCISIDVPPAALIARSLVPADDLPAASHATALAINPVLDLATLSEAASPPQSLSIGLGQHVPTGLDLYLGWAGGCGAVATKPMTDDHWDTSSVFGAAASAVLGASALFRLAHGQPVRDARLNPIELSADLTAGTRDHPGPVEIGSVLTVGAGAVASGAAYWARELGITGEPWDFVDGDIVELHNTNRCLTMTAAHAGWADGSPSGKPVSKAEATAWVVDGCSHEEWYEQWLIEHQERHDLVLCLANERGVRPFVTQRGEPLLLHATTSPQWTAELHRHLPSRDDCPACRLPDTRTAKPMCASGPVSLGQPDSPDAALPFLSAAAGLLLVAALAELPRGVLQAEPRNHWQLDLTFAERLFRSHRWQPSGQCPHTQPRSIRRMIQREDPRRWDHLDTATDGTSGG
ncbi:hypothetical protein [Haloechinothrix halophila]|uniref:hypothetical protein n=1 Tax=Haloechinothrix halophila TaxID=1069073 RepID=UPI00054F3E08|nr:hypothetical protein [Haloechinothrix halophila]